MTLTLRPYQQAAVSAIRQQWQRGKQRTLLFAATGTGKTEMILGTLQAELAGGEYFRALVIAHRKELIEQPRDRIGRHWPDLAPAGIVMADQDDYSQLVTIATIQTLQASGRLDRMLALGPFTHLVIDEAHHATAESYRCVLDRCQAAYPALRVLGATATPRRTDGTGLRTVFESVAFELGIKQAIQEGCLTPFRAIGVALDCSLSGVRETADGWDDAELGDVLEAQNVHEIVLSSYQTYGEGRKAIAYCASVKQAYALAQYLNQHGVSADCADGSTKPEVRNAILDRFRNNGTRVLVNCNLWTEGLDIPDVGVLLQVRPTKSDLIYIQMVGRVLRTHPTKQEAIVIDFQPRDAHNLVMAGDILGKPRAEREAELKARKRGVLLDSFGIDASGQGIDAEPDKVRMRMLDLLGGHPAAWTVADGYASCPMGKDSTLLVRLPQKDRIAAALKVREAGRWLPSYDAAFTAVSNYHLYKIAGKEAVHIGSYGTWDACQEAAESLLDGVENGRILVDRSKEWRREAATEKQTALLKRLGIWTEDMDKGKASQALSHFFARKAVERLAG